MPMEHKAVGHSCLAAFFYYFANAQFPMRGGNVCESVLANGCQTGFLPILFTVANWTKWEQPTNFPVTANAVLFVGGAFPGVSLASLTPPTPVLLSPLRGFQRRPVPCHLPCVNMAFPLDILHLTA
jgi:hypothetical protein